MAETDQPLPAGGFAAWLGDMQRALRGDADAEVPCNGCTACCRASQFIHIEPDETEALARVPAELVFPAPQRPQGHVVLGYDENGHCPMLVDDVCSIYDVRPRTCRTYDCRIFPATGIDLEQEDGEHAKVEIARRARRWQFDLSTEEDRVLFDAVREATRFVREREGVANATQRAVLAIRRVDRLPRDLTQH
jgi:Fe-S-cluster containining protein